MLNRRYVRQMRDPMLGTLDGFLADLPICFTAFGVRSLMRKHFLIEIDFENYLVVSVSDLISLEFIKRSENDRIIKECRFIENGKKIILWKQQKCKKDRYYSTPEILTSVKQIH